MCAKNVYESPKEGGCMLQLAYEFMLSWKCSIVGGETCGSGDPGPSDNIGYEKFPRKNDDRDRNGGPGNIGTSVGFRLSARKG